MRAERINGNNNIKPFLNLQYCGLSGRSKCDPKRYAHSTRIGTRCSGESRTTILGTIKKISEHNLVDKARTKISCVKRRTIVYGLKRYTRSGYDSRQVVRETCVAANNLY